jgi:hypothetical protein
VDVGQVLGRTTLTLCVRVRLVCVFYFQTCFSYKGLVGNWLPINYRFFQQLVSELGCGEMQSLKFGIEGSTECKGIDHGRSTELTCKE